MGGSVVGQVVIARGVDGYYHPSTEEEVVALVRYAAANALQIRVRGASHSTAWSVFTDSVDDKPENRTLNRRPPAGPNLDLVLDRMNRLTWIDEAHGVVEAEAGIHLGADPYDPVGVATLENSLLYQLFQKGWGLNDLGGITHQTVSGFLATGSAGGSLRFDLDNVLAFRVVDGTGAASWIERDDPVFDAVAVSMGLLGIVTKVRLRLNRTFVIDGNEVTTPTTGPDCPIDLFGPGTATTPSMRQFLETTDYSRVLWWPQSNAERVVIWQAIRQEAPPSPEQNTVPYREFTPDLGGWVQQLAAGILYLLLGNPGFAVVPKLRRAYGRFAQSLAATWSGGLLARTAAVVVAVVLAVVLLLPTLVFILFPALLRALFPTVLNAFQPLGPGQTFHDHYWRSLCMDNTADDILLGTEFTEIWVPITYTERAMTLMRDMFAHGGAAATGYYSTEVYGAGPSSAWLSPAYSDGSDEYKDGVVRFDVFWFRDNASEPNVAGGYFQQYWELFAANGIPFRFHWGKFIPAYDLGRWAEHYRASLPRFADFLQLRARRDPHDVFFTRYWRERFTTPA